MTDEREPEELTQAEVERQAADVPDDPHTHREEVELDRMEGERPTTDPGTGTTAD